MTLDKRRLMLLFAVLTAVIVSSISLIVRYYSVPKGKFQMNCDNGFIIIEEEIMFDTGSSGTIYFKGKDINKIRIGSSRITDTHEYKTILDLYLVYRSHSKEFPLKFFTSMIIDEDNFPYDKSRFKAPVSGLIGMNVIRRVNWHFSFKENYLEVFRLYENFTIPASAISLDYSDNRVPKTTVQIGKQQIQNVLLDAGCDIDFVIDQNNIGILEKYPTVKRNSKNISGLLGEDQVKVFFDFGRILRFKSFILKIFGPGDERGYGSSKLVGGFFCHTNPDAVLFHSAGGPEEIVRNQYEYERYEEIE